MCRLIDRKLHINNNNERRIMKENVSHFIATTEVHKGMNSYNCHTYINVNFGIYCAKNMFALWFFFCIFAF